MYNKIKSITLFFVTIVNVLFFMSCHQEQEYKTVICVPVYGQSLALGEEAERITDFDSLANYADGRIVTENLDYNFGYFDNDELKQFAKKMLRYQKRSYELSIYSMAKVLADNTGKDTLICIFPGGQGATAIADLSKGTPPYEKFMNDIETAYNEASSNGWDFVVPAICWMQGESDIVDYPGTDYQQLLTKIWEDMNHDIQQITHQRDTIRYVCYQTNSLMKAPHFAPHNYDCPEVKVPQTFIDVIRENPYFWASSPIYQYSFVNDNIHIDAESQQSIGKYAARSVLGIIKGGERFCGLTPVGSSIEENSVLLSFNIPSPPLVLDTIRVRKIDHDGFSVIDSNNEDIVSDVILENDKVRINCSKSPLNCKVRYAVNGERLKSGNKYGPRGNLRDSSGNWCFQFEMYVR